MRVSRRRYRISLLPIIRGWSLFQPGDGGPGGISPQFGATAFDGTGMALYARRQVGALVQRVVARITEGSLCFHVRWAILTLRTKPEYLCRA